MSVEPAINVPHEILPPRRPMSNQARPACTSFLRQWWDRRHLLIAILALTGIGSHLVMRYALHMPAMSHQLPLLVTLTAGGTPLILVLAMKVVRRQFGSDLLAGISIISAVLLGQYLAGSLVVLMLSGGQTLEAYAIGSASSVLAALARRMPSTSHRKSPSGVEPVSLETVRVDDTLVIFPHEICPVDGVVIEGHGAMDESYLTGEPFRMSKAPGSEVLSGSVNGDAALIILATKRPKDSRYERIIQVMRASERDAPRLRRLGDQLGAFYTPLALVVAVLAWMISGSALRFLAVLVVATPCPLLIAIPVAIVSTISLCARRGIIIKKPVVLEQAPGCSTLIFDKTGTLTYGEPRLSELFIAPEQDRRDVLSIAASIERYSKHPLAKAVTLAAENEGLPLLDVSRVSELPGEGLQGMVAGRQVEITSRRKLLDRQTQSPPQLPAAGGGLECVVLMNGAYAATLRFRDEPRAEGHPFVRHLQPRHGFKRLMLLSGDRESEVKYLAAEVGIHEFHAEQNPKQKLAIVQHEVRKAPTLYLGDGINDAPALMAATVGVAMGHNSDITTEAAGAIILDNSLARVDEFLHIGRRMRRIALQSAIGGMAASAIGMILAATGYLTPVAGAIAQEVIDILAVANALRAAAAYGTMSDFSVKWPKSHKTSAISE